MVLLRLLMWRGERSFERGRDRGDVLAVGGLATRTKDGVALSAGLSIELTEPRQVERGSGVVQEALFHLTLLGHVIIIIDLRGGSVFHVAVALEIKHGEAADVANAVDMNRERAEKVNDLLAA
ncbi:hypothetical protein BC937DRAFT_94157 [Endogone sp. FLAS-F59071]|nr:hypothetical protein BC937DRAFT_94157 [Endogone sp. FLAS-F59071]|eukprot:RUS20875.1 hypothetical protein BC937DRAFT_94157 [Endogone sp. FLAS-F59071]